MTTLERRIERLEKCTHDVANASVMRVVISACGRPLNLAGSSCDRMLGAKGSITEIVRLDGSRDQITDEGLDAFVASFPVQRSSHTHRRDSQIGAEKSRW
jgi:hypothetical protein